MFSPNSRWSKRRLYGRYQWKQQMRNWRPWPAWLDVTSRLHSAEETPSSSVRVMAKKTSTSWLPLLWAKAILLRTFSHNQPIQPQRCSIFEGPRGKSKRPSNTAHSPELTDAQWTASTFLGTHQLSFRRHILVSIELNTVSTSTERLFMLVASKFELSSPYLLYLSSISTTNEPSRFLSYHMLPIISSFSVSVN